MRPRRYLTLLLALFLSLAILIALSSFRSQLPVHPAVKSVLDESILSDRLPKISIPNLPKFEIPSLRFSFQKSPHKPPDQKNSTHAGSSWYSDWKWLNPFSSSVTLDEERIVLPPLPERPPVYTYYEPSSMTDRDTAAVDDELLRIWSRAWWAKGFRPVVLSDAEAMSHPLYPTFQQLDVSSSLRFEISRWLAWSHMGTGLLASWHCVPMASYNDPMLASLRYGRFENLIRVDGIGAGIFAGEKTHIDLAIQKVVSDLKLNTYSSIIEAIGADGFRIEEATSIAHYDSRTVEGKYPILAQLTKENPIKGRRARNQLINAHLHTTWQNVFNDGIAILKPLPAHTTALIEPSLHLAKLLAECPETIVQSSCPPNRPKCSPCVGSKMRYATMGSFHNVSSLFTIGTVPHPYTMTMLNYLTENFDTRYIRRETTRDQWLFGATRDALGDGRGAPGRVIAFKDFVASESGSVRSLWFVAEDFPGQFYPPPPPPKSPTNEDRPKGDLNASFPDDWLEQFEWHFGFAIPRTRISHGESYTPVPSPDRWAKLIPGMPAERRKSWDPAPPTEVELAKEVELIQLALKTIRQQRKQPEKMMGVAEAWNLADAEAWKFVKAYSARNMLEIMQYREEESAVQSRSKSRWWFP